MQDLLIVDISVTLIVEIFVIIAHIKDAVLLCAVRLVDLKIKAD